MSATVAFSRAADRTSCSRGVSGLGPSLERRRGEAGIDDALAAHRAADRARERLGWIVLEQEAGGPLFHGAAQVARAPEGGQHEHLAVRQLGAQLRRGLQPVGAGHLDVQQGDVGALLQRGREDLVAARHLGHDLDVGLQREQAGKRAADHGLVLGEQHPDHPREPTGTMARTRKPGPSSRGPASRRPPASRTRVSSPMSPVPLPSLPLPPWPSSTTSTVA